MSELILYLPMPVSINAAYANGGSTRGRIKTKAAYAWIKEAEGDLMRQKRPQMKPPYLVVYSLGKPIINRRRDCFNYEKLLSDFLVKNGIIEDDCLIEDGRIHWDKSVSPGQVRISIKSLGE